MDDTKILIYLGSGEKGTQRKGALEQLAADHGFFWGNEPSIGRLIVALADGEMEVRRAMDYSGYEIEIGFSDDSIFGSDPEAIEGIDQAASADNYAVTLRALLEREFPNASIEIEHGINDQARVENWNEDVSWRDVETVQIEVEELIHRHWESWEWVVERQVEEV